MRLLESRTNCHYSFSQGKSSALVIDIGASMVSVTPVHDGMVLKKGKAKRKSRYSIAKACNRNQNISSRRKLHITTSQTFLPIADSSYSSLAALHDRLQNSSRGRPAIAGSLSQIRQASHRIVPTMGRGARNSRFQGIRGGTMAWTG